MRIDVQQPCKESTEGMPSRLRASKAKEEVAQGTVTTQVLQVIGLSHKPIKQGQGCILPAWLVEAMVQLASLRVAFLAIQTPINQSLAFSNSSSIAVKWSSRESRQRERSAMPERSTRSSLRRISLLTQQSCGESTMPALTRCRPRLSSEINIRISLLNVLIINFKLSNDLRYPQNAQPVSFSWLTL